LRGTVFGRLWLVLLAVALVAACFAAAARADSGTPLPKGLGAGGEDGICGVAYAPPGDAICNESESAPLPSTYDGGGNNNPQPGYHDNGRGGNTFVNDPCLDPPAPNRARTVQSETDEAVDGNNVVVGYNDSYGFYDNTQGLSGFSYSVNGGNTFIDGGGLPPLVPTHSFYTDPTSDHYFGDPVVVVDKSARTFTHDSAGNPITPIHQPAGTFYYSSLYSPPGNPYPGAVGTISVNRGVFTTAPPQNIESIANTSCLNGKRPYGTPDTTNLPKTRVVWDPPSIAVPGTVTSLDFLDKEWLYVSQATGELYLTYTRFAFDTATGAQDLTPLEMVRSMDGGRTWTAPTVIQPNYPDTFNTASQTTQTATGRLVVTWYSTHYAAGGFGPEDGDQIQYAISDDDGVTFSPAKTIQVTNPQGEPPGYNRGRSDILNAPSINTYPHGTDVYITYFSGTTPLQAGVGVVGGGPIASSGNIYLAASHDNGDTFTTTKVNDDPGLTSHVFPTVQVNKNGSVFDGWTDRRNDPMANELTDTWAAVSKDGGATFGHNVIQTDVATSWRARADARPNFGDYNSSELLGNNQFVMTWADGRFPPPAPTPQAATPDVIFSIANGLGNGNG
jgi:hypothetical protein